jgi:hypothetical protein
MATNRAVLYYGRVTTIGVALPNFNKKGLQMAGLVDICQVKECRNMYYAHGYCCRHYQQLKAHGKISKRTRHDSNEFLIEGCITKINLYNKAQKLVAQALIDTVDLPKVKCYKWYQNNSTGYVMTGVMGSTSLLHRLILPPKEGFITDHTEGDKLDNRKSKLRYASVSQNGANQKIMRNNTSGFKGVTWCKQTKKWKVTIQKDGKSYFLGRFSSIKLAVDVYDHKALKLHDKFAKTNEMISNLQNKSNKGREATLCMRQ